MKKFISLLLIFCLCFTAVASAATYYTTGSRGDGVKTLQSNLNKLGYSLEVDGIFGNATKNAVFDFQRKYGLETDGIAGQKTLAKINELLSASSVRTLKEGCKGDDVRQLQQRLNELGGYGLAVDGSFGPATKRAVKDFQSRYGLDQDGIVGPLTREKLNSATPYTTTKTDTGNTGKPLDNVSKVSKLNQEVGGWCKATAVAQSLNIIKGRDAYSRHDLWVKGVGCGSIDGRTYTGSNGITYKATYKYDSYRGSEAELRAEIERSLADGLPIVITVHSKYTYHHWVTVVGKTGNDYQIIETSYSHKGNRVTTMSAKGYSLGLSSYGTPYRYGYVSFRQQ